MEVIKRSFGTFTVYTREEADAEGLKYVHWKDVEEGGWALTDDQFVAKCVKRKKHKGGTQFTFPFGRPWRSSHECNFWEYYTKGAFYTSSPMTWAEAEARRGRTARVVKAYASMLLGGKIDWKALGQIYRPNQAVPEATVRRLFRREEIKSMADAEVARLLKEKGITKETVLEMYMEAKDLAKGTEDPKAIITVADRLADLLEMTPQKGKKVVQLEQFGAEILGEIDKGVNKARIAYQSTTTEEPLRIDDGNEGDTSGGQSEGAGS
jgi:hypothetical protein